MSRTCDRSIGFAAPLIAAIALSGWPGAGLAQKSWAPDGVRVASSYADRMYPVAVPDGSGGVYVAWQEWARIRLQRLNEDGGVATGWSTVQGREVCPPLGSGGYLQSSPRAVPDGAGGVYVIWHDERNTGCFILCHGEPKQLFVQRFGPDGSIAPGWPADGVDAGSWLSRMWSTPNGSRGFAGEMNTVAVADGRGGLLLAWIEQAIRANPEPGLRVQRISPAGERLWGDRGVLICALPGEPVFPSIAPDRNGGAIVVWQDERSDAEGSRLYVQRMTPEGVPILIANGERATLGLEPNERYARLSPQTRDGALLVWEAGADPDRRSLFARQLLVPVRPSLPGPARVARRSSPEVRLTDSAQPAGELAVLADASEGSFIAWVDVRGSDGLDVFAHRLLRNGRLMPTWPDGGAAVATSPSQNRSRPMLAPDGAGGVFVGWRDVADPRVTLLTAAGEVAQGWPADGLALTTETGVDQGLDLVSDGQSAAIGVWDQWVPEVGVDDVLAQRVDCDLVAPTLASPEPRDRNAPGEGAAFALDGLRPNPSHGPLAFSLALPSSEPATLELFDLAGRRLAARDVGALGAGRHLVRLEPEAPLAPGVVLIRLTQGGRTLTARGVVSR